MAARVILRGGAEFETSSAGEDLLSEDVRTSKVLRLGRDDGGFIWVRPEEIAAVITEGERDPDRVPMHVI